jgi:hypothetical protein
MDLMTLKETLGHSSIRTTEIYLTMSEARLREQQRKTNPFAGVKLPKAVSKAKVTALDSPRDVLILPTADIGDASSIINALPCNSSAIIAQSCA